MHGDFYYKHVLPHFRERRARARAGLSDETVWEVDRDKIRLLTRWSVIIARCNATLMQRAIASPPSSTCSSPRDDDDDSSGSDPGSDDESDSGETISRAATPVDAMGDGSCDDLEFGEVPANARDHDETMQWFAGLGATEAGAGAGSGPVVAEVEVVAAADVHPVEVGAVGARRSSFTTEEMFDFNRRMANRTVRFGVRGEEGYPFGGSSVA